MFVIEQVALGEADLVSSNVPETDYAVWSSATAYAIGNRVILTTGVHKVYEAIAAGTNKPPQSNLGTFWIEVSATNRWKIFDKKISDPTQQAGQPNWRFTLPATANAVALFGLNADTVTVRTYDPLGTITFNRAFSLNDLSEVIDWWSYFFAEVENDTEFVVSGVPAYLGHDIQVFVDSGGITEVGQIVIGKQHQLGKLMNGATIGVTDYSRKERDTFGNPIIVERAFAQRASYQFSLPTLDARRVEKLVAKLRATAAVYYGAQVGYGNTIYGFFSDFKVTLSNANVSFATLEVEGLV